MDQGKYAQDSEELMIAALRESRCKRGEARLSDRIAAERGT